MLQLQSARTLFKILSMGHTMPPVVWLGTPSVTVCQQLHREWTNGR